MKSWFIIVKSYENCIKKAQHWIVRISGRSFEFWGGREKELKCLKEFDLIPFITWRQLLPFSPVSHVVTREKTTQQIDTAAHEKGNWMKFPLKTFPLKFVHLFVGAFCYFLPDVFCIRFNFRVSTFDACVCHFLLSYLFPATDVLHGSCKKVTTTTTKKVDRRSFLLPNNRKSSPATFTWRCRSFFALKFFLPSSLSISEKNFHQ